MFLNVLNIGSSEVKFLDKKALNTWVLLLATMTLTKENHEYSNIVANILPADPLHLPHTRRNLKICIM